MAAIAWTTAENALRAWVLSASGLPEERVIWMDEAGVRPQSTYIAMRIDAVTRVGLDWLIYDDAPVPAPGEELRSRARGHRTALLHFQCFAPEGSGGLATRVLTDVVAAIPLHVYALDEGGVGVGDASPVQYVEGPRGSILEPRAFTEVTLHLASELEARETYIERVNITVTPENPAGVELDSVNFWTPE
jgi:hypothetical protein